MFGDKKVIETELFLFKKTEEVTKEDYDNFVLFEERDELFWIENNMIGKIVTKIKPILISRIEMPYKNDLILVEQLDGNFDLQMAHKNLSNKDLYIESKRVVCKVISDLKDVDNEFLNKIKTKTLENGSKVYVECLNRLFKMENEKEMDYMFYDSKEAAFKIKEPLNLFY